jgi:hypothetical protein
MPSVQSLWCSHRFMDFSSVFHGILCLQSVAEMTGLHENHCFIPLANLHMVCRWSGTSIYPSQVSVFRIAWSITFRVCLCSKHHLHRPNTNLVFKKSMFFAGIKIFNSLPRSVTVLKNEKANFRLALRACLHAHSFYPLDEIFMCRDYQWYCF